MLKKLARLALALDILGLEKEADALTHVMERRAMDDSFTPPDWSYDPELGPLGSSAWENWAKENHPEALDALNSHFESKGWQRSDEPSTSIPIPGLGRQYQGIKNLRAKDTPTGLMQMLVTPGSRWKENESRFDNRDIFDPEAEGDYELQYMNSSKPGPRRVKHLPGRKPSEEELGRKPGQLTFFDADAYEKALADTQAEGFDGDPETHLERTRRWFPKGGVFDWKKL